MSKWIRIDVILDPSVENRPVFQGMNKLTISKADIFKNGILMNPVSPKAIRENDYSYLQSKVPSYADLHEDWIEFSDNKIINHAVGRKSRKKATEISDIIGVGVGLTYAIKRFGLKANEIESIPDPKKKSKFLDFVYYVKNLKYLHETKGTASTYITSFKNDIINKKIDAYILATTTIEHYEDQFAVFLGTITHACSYKDTRSTTIVVMDDYNERHNDKIYDIYHFLSYYMFILSVTYDRIAYNQIRQDYLARRISQNFINLELFGGRYIHNGEMYWGQFFDSRLIVEKIRELHTQGIEFNAFFALMTEHTGKRKYFLGISQTMLNAMNNFDIITLQKGTTKIYLDTEYTSLILDNDGMIFIKSFNQVDSQIEQQYPEETVKNRLMMIFEYLFNERHVCGAPCRSRNKQGQPCQIKTYRDHCHFHREH